MFWHRITLSREQAGVFNHVLMNGFTQLYDQARQPRGMALFAVPGGRDYYTSPASTPAIAAFLERWNATQSTPPNAADVELIVGNEKDGPLLEPITVDAP